MASHSKAGRRIDTFEPSSDAVVRRACRAHFSSSIRTLNRLIDWYGPPLSIRMDNGPEMTSHDFADWAAAKGIALDYIEPGEPNQNAYIERFNRTYRHEVLDAYVFKTIV